MLASVLWEMNLDLAEACLATPFVVSMIERTLSDEAASSYDAQHDLICEALGRACSVAAARFADQPSRVNVLQRQYSHVDDGPHLVLVDDSEPDADDPLPATQAYLGFLQQTAWQDAVAETLAAVTPHMRLHAFLGQALRKHLTPDHPHREWIRHRSDPGLVSRADEIEKLLNDAASDDTAVRVTYRYAMQCELDCFTEALAPAD